MKPLAMRPQGLLGRGFGVLMERLNRPAYRAAARLLAPREGQRLLEIGFGTGRLVEMLLAAAPGVEVAGVDPTPTMVAVASRRPAVVAAGGRVDLREGLDHPLPWDDARFDAAAALHCFQFWPDPSASIREIARVLRPGGRLLLVLRDHARNPPKWLPNPLSRSGVEAEGATRLLAEHRFAVRNEEPVGSSRVLLASAPADPRTG